MTETSPEPKTVSSEGGAIRLQRALASAGIASRRQSEQIIREGRVSVDGQTVTQLGTKVDPRRQKIAVDGQAIRYRRHVYFLLNKPPGVLSTNADESGRLRAIDLIETTERIYTVGRLDKSSEGLLLVTNDGDWANRLTHPRYGVDKTYLVRVVGRPTIDQLSRLRSGIHLAEGVARAAEIRIKKPMQNCTDLEIVLKEGRNREIRRVMASLGHKVVSLKRIAIGPIRLGELPRGAYRELTPSEVDALRGSAGRPGPPKTVSRKPRRGSAWTKPGRYAPKSVGHDSPRGTVSNRRRSTRGPQQKPGPAPSGKQSAGSGNFPRARRARSKSGKPTGHLKGFGRSRSPRRGTNRGSGKP